MFHCRDIKTTLPDYLGKYNVILENISFHFMLARICVAPYRYFSKINKNQQIVLNFILKHPTIQIQSTIFIIFT